MVYKYSIFYLSVVVRYLLIPIQPSPAAIKTQPYDLLRWSYEYFCALSEHRPPPVKLRLEYPVFSTEGGLTRGYLKVLACQVSRGQCRIVVGTCIVL